MHQCCERVNQLDELRTKRRPADHLIIKEPREPAFDSAGRVEENIRSGSGSQAATDATGHASLWH